MPSNVLNTEPLTTLVPSKVLSTEPLTIPLASVICDEPLTKPLGTFVSCVKSDVPPPLPNPLEAADAEIYASVITEVICAELLTIPTGKPAVTSVDITQYES